MRLVYVPTEPRMMRYTESSQIIHTFTSLCNQAYIKATTEDGKILFTIFFFENYKSEGQIPPWVLSVSHAFSH